MLFFLIFFWLGSAAPKELVANYISELEAYREQGQWVLDGGPSKVMAFGYAGCLDLSVSAQTFIDKVVTVFGLDDQKFEAVNHSHLHSAKDLVETFLYYFQEGANAEMRIDSPDLFGRVKQLAMEILERPPYLGGNAVTMALSIKKQIGFWGTSNVKLILGAGGLRDWAAQLQGVELVDHSSAVDTHLALEYTRGLRILGQKAPRSNRFYLNADTFNIGLGSFDEFHQRVDELLRDSGQFLLCISGLQLLLESEGWRIPQMTQRIELHLQGKPDLRVHFEMAAFRWQSHFQAFIDHLFPLVDSLGLNEQEIQMLAAYVKDPQSSPLDQTYPSDPEGPLLLDALQRVIAFWPRLNRVHLHSLSFHSVCYQAQKWGPAMIGLSAGLLKAASMTCGKSGIRQQGYSKFEVSRALELFKLGALDDLIVHEYHVKGRLPGQPGWICEIGPALVCDDVVRTAGVGDSISAIGLLLHEFVEGASQTERIEL